MSGDFWNGPHEQPITLLDLVSRLRSRVPRGAEIVLIAERGRVANMDRWIIASVGKKLSTIEVWLPSRDHHQVFPALGKIWKPLWGAGDTSRATPGAIVSWSILWTLGPLPLRVWSRQGLLVSIDAEAMQIGAETWSTRQVVGAKLSGNVRLRCLLCFADGTFKTIVSKWNPIKIFGPVAAVMSGIVFDDYSENRLDAEYTLVPLAERINAALMQANGRVTVSDLPNCSSSS